MLESGLVHSRFPDTPDPVTADFRSVNSDPEPVDIKSRTVPKTMSADGTISFTSDPDHSDFKDPGAATSKNRNAIVHSSILTDFFYPQGSR